MKSFFEQLNVPYTLIFGGQGSAWAPQLNNLSRVAKTAKVLTSAWEKARAKVAPVILEITTSAPGGLDSLTAALEGNEDALDRASANATVSVPGITLAQFGTALTLDASSLHLRQNKPVAFLGHSQGVLGAELVRAYVDDNAAKVADLLALAILVGAAASRATAQAGAAGTRESRPMVSLRGLPLEQVQKVCQNSVSLAVYNGDKAGVLSGRPRDLEVAVARLQAQVEAANADIASRRRGGSAVNLQVDQLDVAVPFHNAILEDAVAEVSRWAKKCGIDVSQATKLARQILVEPTRWPEALRAAQAAGTRWFLNVGPGPVLAQITAPLIAGAGIGVVSVGDEHRLADLDTPGYSVSKPLDYSEFAPRLNELPNGKIAVSTKFTRLTGYSPIMLPAMTPTTVDAGIVAAAANGGYWAELAGGGQYSPEVLQKNLNNLSRLLEPGRAAQFNSMFFDRYMWNLQFGVQRIVPKARANGAAVNGVTISAGIPEVEEATKLIESLNEEGFRYVCFKPGTVEQIRQVLAIAGAAPDRDIIMQVEDGTAGGHHSWESLDDLLLATYHDIRRAKRVVLAVGGGIGTPQKAASYICGKWALAYGRQPMPVDAVMIGTAAMTVKEATTSRAVKQLLKDTPGIDDGWIGRGAERGGITSGLSHLDADMYEIENSSAKASRLIHQIGSDAEELERRRDEVIAAINKTAKPYFGDLEDMTYAQWASRTIELCYPWADPTWNDRVWDLFRHIEARLCEADHGPVETLFATVEDIEDGPAALERLLAAYPNAREVKVISADAAWFVDLCRKYVKPMPFVPVIDTQLARWWGRDTLWQSHDERFDADAVRIIPGPRSVGAIDRIDEPIAQMFARYEAGVAHEIEAAPTPVYSRLAEAPDEAAFIAATPLIEWNGNLVENPFRHSPAQCSLRQDEDGLTLVVACDSLWDGMAKRPYAVPALELPLSLPEGCAGGAYPVVDMDRLAKTAYHLLAGAAGVGSTATSGQVISQMPTYVAGEGFGEVHGEFLLGANVPAAHAAVTGAALDVELASFVPDALVGPCWPTIYGALGTATYGGYPVIEGLINAVHLDHTVRVLGDIPYGQTVTSVGRCAGVAESASGRVVRVEVSLYFEGREFAQLIERFAIRGRVTTSEPASPSPHPWSEGTQIEDTPRKLLRRMTVTAPADMTAFANVSGDFNPIHTSYSAARMAGLSAPLVHGMWLSATAQHAIRAEVEKKAGFTITAWTYAMFGMVNLNDQVSISIERVGRIRSGGLVLEATCKIGDELVSRGTALTQAPATAYVYPGQGIQKRGMGKEDRARSSRVREVWQRADRFTRAALGFSILTVVDENPTELKIGSEIYRHPAGVMNLTQFTQVALATLAYAQTERLKEEGVFQEGAAYAGHSLGEYNALAACADIFPLEKVIEIVYQRGSAMHHLVERDEAGRSNYAMGALRPNQFGVGDGQVRDYVAAVAKESGQFLEIVNYNLAGAQYAVAGTLAGLKALEADAAVRAKEWGGKRPFMLIPGIDVPFHSSVLRPGVAEFRQKLDDAIPAQIDTEKLVNRYIPNLVARPFEVSEAFAKAILEVVPSKGVAALIEHGFDDYNRAARTLLIELLAWQFASPVRWIETQKLLLSDPADGGLGIDQYIEVGLSSSPTLANLAAKTLRLPEFSDRHVEVLNVERDSERIFQKDTAPQLPQVQPAPAPVASPAEQAEQPVEAKANAHPAPQTQTVAQSGSTAPELSYDAGDGIMFLLAYANKLNLGQVEDTDTVETLTNGISSKRNQLLMDIAAEVSLPGVDGAEEADVKTLREKVREAASSYTPFGPVLSEIAATKVRALLGGAGLGVDHIGTRLEKHWALPAGWEPRVREQIVLGTREGDSVRGGSLTSLPTQVASKAEADELIDEALALVAKAQGVALTPAVGAASGGGVVDSAELDNLRSQVLGEDGILAELAKDVLARLGVQKDSTLPVAGDAGLLESVEAELGADWQKFVSPAFDPNKAVLLDDRWALYREDLAQAAAALARGEELVADERWVGAGATVAAGAKWHAGRSQNKAFFEEVAEKALQEGNFAFANDVALVTGAAPNAIAAQLVARLLWGGATVVMTASKVTQKRLQWAKNLYHEHARGEAALWLVPANLASLRDIHALTQWIGSERRETVGGKTTVTKPALLPTLAFPFAAPPVLGRLGEDPRKGLNEFRLLLTSVEATIFDLAQIGMDTAIGHRVHVILPGSPNRGTFGGDGLYGEAKASLDAICNKWKVESGWPERITLAHPRIGWVAGTNLMGGNDAIVPAAKKAGIHVYSTDEIAGELIALASPQVREQACEAPVEADLTGGLEKISLSLTELAASVEKAPAPREEKQTATVAALPSPRRPKQATAEWAKVSTPLEDMVVIVGAGEVGAWGSSRTRLEAELGISPANMSTHAVIELAWMMGLLTWKTSPTHGWYNSQDELVPEEQIHDRYANEVIARCGIRPLGDDSNLRAGGSDDVTTMYLPDSVTFEVASEEAAKAYQSADPAHTDIYFDEKWFVRKLAGAKGLVPTFVPLTRTVGGQLPDGFDPAKWGISAGMVEALDRIAAWNLVTAIDAFTSAGFTPSELLHVVHPADVASTQGTGIGGMESLRQVFLTRYLGEERPQDILQEALPNVVAAHTMQSYVGGYGSMIHPVGACATAAVSIEEGVDKIALGKADFVIAGGIDDISVESLTGFGDMNATANSAEMAAKGIDSRFFSRAGDRRRGGFVEAAGGGTVLLARGSVAAKLGLPVLGVIAYARSFADGAHTSIPAPGLGALAAGRGGKRSDLAKALAGLGLSPDDIAVVSKHDTSTNANDPNEAELHSRLAKALGRSSGNPLYVVSQKSLTGHAKGGAALFQTVGLTQIMSSGIIPANQALDCLDPAMRQWEELVWLRSPLDLAQPIKAGVLTSLGFGHVSAVVVVAHPGAFYRALADSEGEEQAKVWLERANERLAAGQANLERNMHGQVSLFQAPVSRRFSGDDRVDHEAEAAMLLDPDARLLANGKYL
ncbi:MAG: DUF1729 domain-containing protein [Winkia neuii]|uniref:polyketide synthase n=1 Tax=Winkia neuii TaxID=33007 RepID=UPI0029018D94|nr:polyketide synthase [Winkia neuii]MDU3134307.1 DUF1729 domain-containing protein [Winkia neuii]